MILGVKESVNLHTETMEHMKRCCVIARNFANYLNWDENDKKLLMKCAMVHDIGKFSIAPEILYKVEPLTDEEFLIIKNHVNVESVIINDKFVRESIAYHHERADGKGYKGVNYCGLSKYPKIVSLIDVYDVMSNKRSYKDTTSSSEEIIQEIEKNIGTQFDEFYGKLFVKFLRDTM